ncbi:MAG: TetR/AcrR family transcriptional regulator [Microthrixaceae bacterium]|nr:TetR/AcrR family transcriptional regulator [Microthrixaceae bacterium]
MDRPLTPRGAQRREQLLEVATARFAERGYQATSIADIVDSMGVGKGVFYWYFQSKEELFGYILSGGMADLRRCQLAAVSHSDDPLVRIPAAIRAAVRWAADHEQLTALFEFAHRDATFGPLASRLRDLLIDDAVAELNAAMDAGAVRRADADALARAILGVTDALTNHGLRHDRRPVDDVCEDIVAFCLEGLGSPARRPA